ncbi:MAG: hypothetical protein K1X35_12170 [Caulobacteraceae bacterium]|nr:hypothetical protein [Caulobacteraceae bacterium]
MKSLWIGAAALAATALLTGCGPRKGEDATAAAVSGGNGGSVAVATSGGEARIVSQAGASGSPDFAPDYPGGTNPSRYAAAQNGKHGGVYAFTTTDPADKVFEFYRSRAEAGGLTTQTNVETGGARIYAADGPRGNLAVTAAPQGDGKTYVQVTWSANG